MKLFFVTPDQSALADQNTELIDGLRETAIAAGITMAKAPADADGIVVNEAFSFKERRYIQRLSDDPVAGIFPHKLYTVNFDDWATGLLRGLYSSLPRQRFDADRHAAIPYFRYYNSLVFSAAADWPPPRFLAGWRGNDGSHKIRRRLVDAYGGHPRFALETTSSWCNHQADEKARYVTVIKDAMFSLCPAGLAPVSFRIFESMALGRAPVLIADDYVYPHGLDWTDFSVAIPERELENLEPVLSAKETQAEHMGRKAREAWDRHFSKERIHEYFLSELMRLIRRGPRSTREEEIERWHSRSMWRANCWTIVQRASRRLQRTIERLASGRAN